MNPTFDLTNAERNFARVMDELGKLPGFDQAKIVRAEAGSILKACAARTKVAPVSKLTVAGQLRALKGLGFTGARDITINAGKRADFGRVFIRKKSGDGFRRTHDANFQPLNQHYSDADWAKISSAVSDAQLAVAKAVKETKLSAGLGRQSWILIAESLGIDLTTVQGGQISAAELSEAAGARAKGGRLYRNGIGREEHAANRYFITLINRLPYGRKIGLDRTLQVVIAGRVSYIMTTFSKGAFESIEHVVRRFPGWHTSGGI